VDILHVLSVLRVRLAGSRDLLPPLPSWHSRTAPLRRLALVYFNDAATTEIYTLSLHDALPISRAPTAPAIAPRRSPGRSWAPERSEEHTSELQSRGQLVCRLLLENKTGHAGC